MTAGAFRDPVGAHLRAGIPLRDHVFEEMCFEGDVLSMVIFDSCTFRRVRFQGCDLTQAIFVQCVFDDVVFEEAVLVRTQWVECEGGGFSAVRGRLETAVLAKCRFDALSIGTRGERVTFYECAVGSLSFTGDGLAQHAPTFSACGPGRIEADGAVWKFASLVEADLSGFSLAGSRLEQCALIRCEAAGLDLSAVRFERCNLYATKLAGAKLAFAEGSIFSSCEFADADFQGAFVAGALFSDASGPRSRFAGASLARSMFVRTNLHGAVFDGADAPESVWMGSDATGASMARLRAPRACLRGTILVDADVAGAVFVEADLHAMDGDLSLADTTGAREGVPWREQRDREIAEALRRSG